MPNPELSSDAKVLIIDYLKKWMVSISSLLLLVFSIFGSIIFYSIKESSEAKVIQFVDQERVKIEKVIDEARTYQIQTVKRIEQSAAVVEIAADNVKKLESTLVTAKELIKNSDNLAQSIADDKGLRKFITDKLSSFPVGSIVAWDPRTLNELGAVVGYKKLPEGWHPCNGKNGTPNLTDHFLKGVSSEVGIIGGSNKLESSGEHNHRGLTSKRASGGSMLKLGTDAKRTTDHDHVIPNSKLHTHNNGDNKPLHYTIIWIIKLS